ncbi:MAG: HDOD domain-containing protein [Rhodoferax sp.]|nr:HDOD domain-containing protein [Rhodoferax sp.]
MLFPTCFDVAARIRKVTNDPDSTLEQVATVVQADPLISSKLMLLANSAVNAASQPAREVGTAIARLGLTVVRSTSLTLAMRQMLLLKNMVNFADMTHQLWEHSLLTASACKVVAQRMTRLDPNEAYFTGMVHDLGAFYMVYRATQYPELVARPQSLKHLVVQWHESVGMTLLDALGLPEDIVEATRDHDCQRAIPDVPHSLQDVLYVSNIFAGAYFEWLYHDVDRATIERYALGPRYLELDDEIREHAQSMARTFGVDRT